MVFGVTFGCLCYQVIHSGDPADKARITELQTAVNQLRLDNEAKRSELFDLRSRFDEKSAQLESFSSEVYPLVGFLALNSPYYYCCLLNVGCLILSLFLP